jgi:2'-5' RNA ligase
VKAIYTLPTPHFTWFTAEALDISKTSSILAKLAACSQRLSTYVFGLGIFSGKQPVLYVPIVKTQAMIDLHNEIWQQVQDHCDRPNDYYSPPHWLPHITLALRDLRPDNLACVLESVAFEPVEMTITAENFIIVAQEEEPVSEALHKYRFSG